MTDELKTGDEVKLNGNPLDEQLGEKLDTDKTYTVLEISRTVPCGSGLAVKIDGHNDWIDSAWFMTDEEKLLKTFDEIGITYVLEKEDQEERGEIAHYTAVWISKKDATLEEAKQYDELIEFRNGELASF